MLLLIIWKNLLCQVIKYLDFVYLWQRVAGWIKFLFFFCLQNSWLICHIHFSFTTRNVNGKVLHDSILSSHWMKVRNRHKNGNFALQKVVQSRHWISTFGTLCHCSRNQRLRTIFKVNYGSVAVKGFTNSFQSTRPSCNQIKKIMSDNDWKVWEKFLW